MKKIHHFLKHAFLISKLSHDVHTQHGCVIVDEKFRVLGMGYNGLPSGFSDNNGVRLERPEKYNWMIHAEDNAVDNCVLPPRGAIAIVTGICCHKCMIKLSQNQLNTVYMYDFVSPVTDTVESKRLRDEVIQESRTEFFIVPQTRELEEFRKILVDIKAS